MVEQLLPPIILQDLKEFSKKMAIAWHDDAFRPPAGLYTLNDAIVRVTYIETRYGPEAEVFVVEYFSTYP